MSHFNCSLVKITLKSSFAEGSCNACEVGLLFESTVKPNLHQILLPGQFNHGKNIWLRFAASPQRITYDLRGAFHHEWPSRYVIYVNISLLQTHQYQFICQFIRKQEIAEQKRQTRFKVTRIKKSKGSIQVYFLCRLFGLITIS